MNRGNVSKTSVKNISASPGYYAIPELKQTYDFWWYNLQAEPLFDPSGNRMRG